MVLYHMGLCQSRMFCFEEAKESFAMALAAIAAGADGLMVEVHNDPAKALCDGPQSLTPEQFDTLMKKVNKTREFFQAL